MHNASKTRMVIWVLALLPLGLVSECQLASAATHGPLAKSVAKGKDIFLHDTFGGGGMTCDACHTDGGRGPTVVPGSSHSMPSLSNAAAVFPRFKQDDGRVMTLAQQIHGCIAGALGGKAPAYDSQAMVDLEVYLTSLSEGKSVRMGGAYK